MSLLTGLLSPDAGRARLFGLDPRAPAARRRLGVMLQSAGMPLQLTVRGQVALFSGYYPDPRPVSETLELAGLRGLERRRCRALSGGQQRSLQFALAICGRPSFLVLDEPTVGLDLNARRALWNVVREEVARGVTVLLTTHHLEEAEALSDRVVVISRGRTVAEGSCAEIKAQVSCATIRCRTSLQLPAISVIPGVRSVTADGAVTLVTTARAEDTVRALLAADLGLSDLTVASATLEDAFLTIIQSTPQIWELAA